nr:AraC family transcriptional regulator [uncultured Dorea sp.]
MYFELKENKPHGTKDDPFSTYHIKNEGRSFQIPVHWHDELEIIYVKSGFLTVSISGENYIGTPGDAFVVSPGNLHFMGSQTGAVDYFTFLFPLKYISFCINDMLEDKLLEPLKNGHLMISPRVEDTAKELCEQLVETYMAKNEKTESKITAQIKTKIILLQFILEMWEKGFVIENDKSGRNIVEKEMISYTQQNFMEKISLKEFGEQFHLSEKYISRYFKEHFHITFSQYITHLRLEHAKQLLQDTDTPVTEVAMQSGYQNVSYFIRSFKKTYGVSPLKYRKK